MIKAIRNEGIKHLLDGSNADDAGDFRPGMKAFDEDNWLVITTGPLTGTGAPCSGRLSISALSPQTGIVASSNCGGTFGYFLKKAGLDALICVGKFARTIAESAQAAGFPSEAITMVKTAHDAVPVLLELAPGAGDAVLVKASHSMELNRVVEGLMA